MIKSETDGFSLVEMLVALAIVALATVAILATPFATKRELSPELTARQIAAKLNAAAAKAVANGQTVNVEIDVEQRTLSVEGSSQLQLPADFTLTLRTGLDLLENEHGGSLLFLADGSSSGGEIALASPSGGTILIRINWVTGGIEVLRVK